jgi:hypothetical protein
MLQRGRKSIASLTAVSPTTTGTRTRPTAPATLSSAEKSTFNQVVAQNTHLIAADGALLGVYITALTQMHRASKCDDGRAWERAAKIAMQAARSLRVTPISATHPDSLARQRRNAQPNPLAEYFAQKDAEADDDE